MSIFTMFDYYKAGQQDFIIFYVLNNIQFLDDADDDDDIPDSYLVTHKIANPDLLEKYYKGYMNARSFLLDLGVIKKTDVLY